MDSAIYRGWLSHRRFAPRPHAFRYPVYLMYLDLAELSSVFRGRWLWATDRPALARFDRRDHLGDPAEPLDQAVRRLVAERTGSWPTGPIRLLTHLRWFGYVFNPVSFYYGFDPTGQRLEWVVAEVNNTPWGERHAYLLDRPHRGTSGGRRRYRSEKVMHVSPFMPMALEYDWGFDVPGERLRVDMVLRPRDVAGIVPLSDGDVPPAAAPCFSATLALTREPLTATTLARVLCRYPAMTVGVIAAIHWQALRLWLKRVPVFTHPSKSGHASGPMAEPVRSLPESLGSERGRMDASLSAPRTEKP